MAIKIKFDKYIDSNGQTKISYTPHAPTLVLMTRNGTKLGQLITNDDVVKCPMNAADELSFSVNKVDVTDEIWDELIDLKLVWCRDWNKVFQIAVETEESNILTKYVTAVGLGEAELSQAYLYDIQINTEDDIARDDYQPTVLYDATHPERSLLNRISEKIPHYSYTYVDPDISGIQRTFSFDGTTIYDAFNQIAEEYECIFKINCYIGGDGSLIREIRVYAIDNYGQDTTIFISTDNLTDDIRFTTDVDSVKNCFRLVGGDDLMTASIINCNPNGSGYIWYFNDDMKNDMSSELSQKIDDYDELYAYYQNEWTLDTTSRATAYNNLINKYSAYTSDYSTIPTTITGYPELMQASYDALDFYYYLHDSLMPTVSTSSTSAAEELAKLTSSALSPVAVTKLSTVSSASAESAVLGLAKVLVDYRYQVKASTSSFTNNVWRGKFTVTNYSDDEDTATSSANIAVTINEDYATYVKQKINKAIQKKSSEDVTDIVSLFDLSLTDFRNELKKYSLTNLQSLRDNCQACVDILVEQGISNKTTWGDTLYESMYHSTGADSSNYTYYDKLGAIDAELSLREAEVAVIAGTYDENGGILAEGLMTFLDNNRFAIQDALNFENYLGETLWHEFSAYRREDTYQNNNYISDGLSNAELFSKSLEFLNVANKEIFKSSTLQHSISATLANLLCIEEFQPIVDYFELGNWLRIKVDDKIYKLRLIEYQFDFSNLDNLNVTFSDVTMMADGADDINSILKQATSMATTYGSVSHQAEQGSASRKQLHDWVNDGLALTTMKIVNAAYNQNITFDDTGFLAREYLPITDEYDQRQVKIINRGLYMTTDNWETAKAGVGEFTFWNPSTQQNETAYGVIADTIVGNIVLSKEVSIYNEAGSVQINEDGISIIADGYSGDNTMKFSIGKTTNAAGTSIQEVLHLDTNGDLVGRFKNLTITGTGGNVPTFDDTNTAIGSAITNYDTVTLNQEKVFNKLTNNGALQGLYMRNNNLYINAEYIETGTLTSIAIQNGTAVSGVYPFSVDANGNMVANSASIKGTITASGGTIGGFTIESDHLHTTNIVATSNAANSVALGGTGSFTRTINGTSRSNLKFAIGSKFGVGNDGTLYAASAIISSGSTPASGVTGFNLSSAGLLQASNAVIYGSIYAGGGTIGGWTIGSNTLTNGTLGVDSSFHMGTSNLSSSNVTIAGNSRSDWRLAIGSKFGVTSNGTLYADSAAFTSYFYVRDSSQTTVFMIDASSSTPSVQIPSTTTFQIAGNNVTNGVKVLNYNGEYSITKSSTNISSNNSTLRRYGNVVVLTVEVTLSTDGTIAIASGLPLTPSDHPARGTALTSTGSSAARLWMGANTSTAYIIAPAAGTYYGEMVYIV